ncbi:4Fe-4S cluster-binding domain-containing protein [Natranaerofaba carboxydovora]|uniref:4Fe-4S cluster-binding domain-containing protein n=1 Tax=Natranaerofaba carboxydovora TaxID=2742683 RepID=UPI001F13E175|nr:4Fe-4S cluster-binding domain-containing protein [Natranaerofaba carboxydovora]UMZ72548.1 hypothetical protein ACONDI_00069 [Natranaerofaba carboxydovora]
MQELKFPNDFNSAGHFCKKTNCKFAEKCILGFNKLYKSMRELRIDFDKCNLNCKLCWSNDNNSYQLLSEDQCLQYFSQCLHANLEYITKINPPKKDPELFKIQGLQIVGGEPLLNKERFHFLVNFLNKLDKYIIENNELARDNLRFLKTDDKFKVKIFTNGITIGKREIKEEDILLLNSFKQIKVEMLLSLKGLNTNEFYALQNNGSYNNFYYQIEGLNKLIPNKHKNFNIDPVLGFYHSEHFNIKCPDIPAEKMFKFDKNDFNSIKLKQILKEHIENKGKFYVEPVHAPRKNKNSKTNFFYNNKDYLENDSLIENDLKSNTKTNYRKTKIKL